MTTEKKIERFYNKVENISPKLVETIKKILGL